MLARAGRLGLREESVVIRPHFTLWISQVEKGWPGLIRAICVGPWGGPFG